MDPTWKHPFTSVVAGPTGSGKTYFVERFITHIDKMMSPVPDEIIWCYSEYQPAYERMSRRGVVFVEGLPKTEEWDINKRRLVIIDDLMNETDESVTRLFTKGSHHRNMSVMYIVQNLFAKTKHQRTISLNAHYLVLFKNPRDVSQIMHLGKQMFPGQAQYFRETFKSATQAPHSYLLVDMRQETGDSLRLRSCIFPNEQHTVFVPRNA